MNLASLRSWNVNAPSCSLSSRSRSRSTRHSARCGCCCTDAARACRSLGCSPLAPAHASRRPCARDARDFLRHRKHMLHAVNRRALPLGKRAPPTPSMPSPRRQRLSPRAGGSSVVKSVAEERGEVNENSSYATRPRTLAVACRSQTSQILKTAFLRSIRETVDQLSRRMCQKNHTSAGD